MAKKTEKIEQAEEDIKSEDLNDVLMNEDKLTKIDEENTDKEKELEDANNQILRLQAEFANFKKRSERDKIATINFALERFVCSLLPILDNFKIAMESETIKDNGFYDGMSLIYRQLIDTLKDNSIVEMEALGEDFDPNFHHAVFMEESDEYESGKVTEVLQTGRSESVV